MQYKKSFLFIYIILFLSIGYLNAQEHLAPLTGNINHKAQTLIPAPPATLSLPFFDDFSYNGPYPSPNLWTSNDAYVNNHLPQNPITWGVATLDALDEHGTPHDTFNRDNKVWADTLMSQNIDLSSYTLGDDIVLSFYVQEAGYGFEPHTGDSIYVFFKNSNNIWERKWAKGVQSTLDFFHVRILIDDNTFLHSDFAFMFVNKATKGINNSMWHLDYVYMGKGRNATTDDINDVSIAGASTTLLNKYHSMPFRHFINNPSTYLKTFLNLHIRNNINATSSVVYNYTLSYNSNILRQGTGTCNTLSMNQNTASFDNILSSAFSGITEDTLTVNGLFEITDPFNMQFTDNNTLRLPYRFSNYFAYDDGTPEMAYFLTMHQSYNIPAMTAVKYNLEVADTLRGFSIFLPQEVPIPHNKEFGIRVYKDIAVNGGTDDILFEELYIYPKFNDTVFGMVQYKFEQPLVMSAGDYYFTLVQPAGGFSDSLYVGLDISDSTTQERYFSVVGSWETSTLPGCLMIRPIVGRDFALTTRDISSQEQATLLFPNPTQGVIQIKSQYPFEQIVVYNSTGQKIADAHNAQAIDISTQPEGLYFVQLIHQNKKYPLQKVLKR